MTALNSGVSQVSQLDFERTGLYSLESKEGYMVRVTECGDDWLYMAYGPVRKQAREGKAVVGLIDPLKGFMPFKAQYEMGEAIPTRRADLGLFRSADFDSPDAAKNAAILACERHYAAVLMREEDQTSYGVGPS